ncbi:f-box protein [Fagus crenata]
MDSQPAFHQSQNNRSLILHSSGHDSPCDPHPDKLFHVDVCINNDDDHCKVVLKDINLPLQNQKFTTVMHCNGLLCLSYVEVVGLLVYNNFCLYNISTAELATTLPPQPTINEYKAVYGFGFHPKTKEYKVVRIVEQEYVTDACNLSMNQRIEVLTVGTNMWRIKKNNPEFVVRMQPCEALVDGALHWLGQDKKSGVRIIASFDLMNEEFCQIPSPNCRLDGRACHLLVLGGCLSVVDYSNRHKIEIWSMKNYGVKESWIKEYTIDPEIPLRGLIRPLCLLRNYKILIQYDEDALFSYEADRKRVSMINIGNLPLSFRAVPIVET